MAPLGQPVSNRAQVKAFLSTALQRVVSLLSLQTSLRFAPASATRILSIRHGMYRFRGLEIFRNLWKSMERTQSGSTQIRLMIGWEGSNDERSPPFVPEVSPFALTNRVSPSVRILELFSTVVPALLSDSRLCQPVVAWGP
ncbi:hypothetical protein THAOC_08001, partial [Thalassiosira oceanica]